MFGTRNAVPRAPITAAGVPARYLEEIPAPATALEEDSLPCASEAEETLRQSQFEALKWLPAGQVITLRVLGADTFTAPRTVADLREVLADETAITSDDVLYMLLSPDESDTLNREIDELRGAHPHLSDEEYDAHVMGLPTCRYDADTNTLWVPPIYYPR